MAIDEKQEKKESGRTHFRINTKEDCLPICMNKNKHMKAIIAGLLFFVSISVYGQQYIVFHIKGKVLADGEALRVKSIITDDTQLTFTSQKDEVHVISPKKGKLLISANKLKKNDRNEFLAAVKNALLPPAQFRTTSTRSEATQLHFEDIYDMMEFFSDTVLLIDTTIYQLNTEELPLNEAHYFEVRYEQGEQTYVKKVPGSNGQIEFYAQHLFSDLRTDQRAAQEVELYYVGPTKAEEELVGRFKLVSATADQITEPLKTLYDAMKSEPEAFLHEEALPFLALQYGKPNPAQVKALLKAITE